MGYVEDQVRRRLQERLVSAGVRQGEVALEVLFWLPDEFIEAYRELFLRALNLPGDGSSLGGSAGDEGRVLTGRAKKSVQAGEGVAKNGKRYYKGEWIVRDENALAVKEMVDRRLRGIVRNAEQKLKAAPQATDGRAGETHGSTPGRVGEAGLGQRKVGDRVQKFCRDCGRVMKSEYVRCPYPHA